MDKIRKSGIPEQRRRRFLHWCSTFCFTTGIAVLAVCCVVWTQARLFQAYANMRFNEAEAASAVRSMNSGGTKHIPTKLPEVSQSIKDGSVIGRLKIKRLGISVIVLQGVDDHTLRIAAGHVPDTALPGSGGNLAIAGHRDTFFRPLQNIRADDTITLDTTAGEFAYKVDAVWVVAPDRVEVLNPTPKPALTLITCYPFHFVGAAPYRFIVRAHQIASDSGSMHEFRDQRGPPPEYDASMHDAARRTRS